ncbi:MAG: hypothetical protein KFF73_10460 [Cyclobacteriaceae bacterium]|nr:hypothetical protein [Cyclobacteriaceae bacterium]
MINPRYLLFILFIICPRAIDAQFSMNEFLSQARNDVRLYEHDLKSSFLEKNPYRSPWIQRTELRLRTNDLNVSADDYRFRINPTNPFEIRENKKYYKMEFEFLFTEYQKALNAALNDRYQLILDLMENHDMEILKNRQISVIADEIRSLDAQTSDPDFNLSDYIEARENLLQTRLESNEISHMIGMIKSEIEMKYSFTGDIFAGEIQLADLQTIKIWLNTIFNDMDTTDNILITSLQNKNLLSEQRINLETAENRRNIGFIQAEYDRDRGNEMDEHVGFQIGVRIPLTNPDRPDISRRKIDLIEDQAGLMEKKAEISLQGELLGLKLDYLFSQYELIINEKNQNDFLRIISLSPDLTPYDLIKAQRSMIRLERIGIQIKWEIYRAYIDFLYYSGRLIHIPLKNYLSENLSEI